MEEQNQHEVDQELGEAVEAFFGDFDSVHLFARLAAFRLIFRYDLWHLINFIGSLWSIIIATMPILWSFYGAFVMKGLIWWTQLEDEINMLNFDA